MAYVKLTTREAGEIIPAADHNQVQLNFDAIIGGDEPEQGLNAQKARIDGHDTDVEGILDQLLSMVRLAADVESAGTANLMSDVTGLSFPVVSGKTYWFRFIIPFATVIATTGSRWSINGPATSMLMYRSTYTLTATTETLNAILTAYDMPAACNATSVLGANIAIIEGFVSPSGDGTIVARFANEVASSLVTAKKGAMLLWREVG